MAKMPGGITTRHLADGNSPNSLSKFHWLDKHSSEAGPKFYWYTIVNDSDIKLELSPSTKPTTCSSVWLGENNFVSSVLTNTRGDSYPVIPLPCSPYSSLLYICCSIIIAVHSCRNICYWWDTCILRFLLLSTMCFGPYLLTCQKSGGPDLQFLVGNLWGQLHCWTHHVHRLL